MNKKCICCNKALELDKHCDENDATGIMLWDGVVFRSRGQYGSRTNDASYEMQIIICDQCIIEKIEMVDEIVEVKPQKRKAVYKPLSDKFTAEIKKGVIEQLKADGAYSERDK